MSTAKNSLTVKIFAYNICLYQNHTYICIVNHKQNSNKMRKAVNITETRLQQTGLGRVDKKEMITTNMVAIDNYGQMPSSSFIKKLVDKGRLDWSYRAKAAHFFTNEFLTDLLNKNIDLFEPEF